jgi:RNA 2',3'-cyclic 3'-phosphodiesterase
MPDTTRTFLAVAVPATLERKLTRLQAQLSGEAPEVRWDVAMPFHVTLAFLGDVGHGDLNAVCLAVAEAASPFERFELTLEGLGTFPGADRPRVVWTGIGGKGLETLKALQAAVKDAATRLNCRPDTRPFHPHVTLGRSSPGRAPLRGRKHGVSP